MFSIKLYHYIIIVRTELLMLCPFCMHRFNCLRHFSSFDEGDFSNGNCQGQIGIKIQTLVFSPNYKLNCIIQQCMHMCKSVESVQLILYYCQGALTERSTTSFLGILNCNKCQFPELKVSFIDYKKFFKFLCYRI